MTLAWRLGGAQWGSRGLRALRARRGSRPLRREKASSLGAMPCRHRASQLALPWGLGPSVPSVIASNNVAQVPSGSLSLPRLAQAAQAYGAQ